MSLSHPEQNPAVQPQYLEILDAQEVARPTPYEVPPSDLRISFDAVRELLNTRNNSTPHDRIVRLMEYAFEANSAAEVSFELLPPAADDVVTDVDIWVQKNRSRVEALKKDPYDLKYLLEDSKGYEERYEWLRNAEAIRKMMPFHHEPIFVATAVRLILVESNEG